jgi:hypothetical protein
MTWVGAAGVSTIALFLGGGCSSSSSGTQAGDSGTGSDGTMGEDSSSQDSGEQADTGTSSGGGDTGTSSGGGDTGTESDTGTVADTGTAGDSSMAADTGSTVDSGTAADTGSTTDSGCSGSAPVDLKLVNYLGWCDLTVAGTALPVPSAGSTVTSHICVAAGATLSATANGSSFIIGTPPLPFVVGTNTTTDNGSTASTTLASGSSCVVACCPFTDGSGCSGSSVTSLCP